MRQVGSGDRKQELGLSKPRPRCKHIRYHRPSAFEFLGHAAASSLVDHLPPAPPLLSRYGQWNAPPPNVLGEEVATGTTGGGRQVAAQGDEQDRDWRIEARNHRSAPDSIQDVDAKTHRPISSIPLNDLVSSTEKR